MNDPHSNSLRTTDGDTLHQRAFLYVAGELDGADLEAFETELADRQAAREAVAAAVAMTQAIALVERSLAATAQHLGDDAPRIATGGASQRWTTAIGWMAAGAAACLLVVLTTGPWANHRRVASSSRQRPGASSETADPTSQRLALAWSQSRQGEPDLEASDDSPNGVSTDTEANDETSDDALEPTPSWVLAAVSASTDGPVPAPKHPVREQEEL